MCIDGRVYLWVRRRVCISSGESISLLESCIACRLLHAHDRSKCVLRIFSLYALYNFYPLPEERSYRFTSVEGAEERGISPTSLLMSWLFFCVHSLMHDHTYIRPYIRRYILSPVHVYFICVGELLFFVAFFTSSLSRYDNHNINIEVEERIFQQVARTFKSPKAGYMCFEDWICMSLSLSSGLNIDFALLLHVWIPR